MTLEEAIEIIKLAQAQIEWDYPMDYAVAFDMAISALQEQEVEHSTKSSLTQKALDIISRQWAIDEIRKCRFVVDAIEKIRALPSAQPERKKGKWVRYDGDWFKTMYKCLECGAMIDSNEKYRNFFCYHCGARMVDPQESEDKKKLSWLGKRCEDCGNKKCKELGELPKGYDCALWQAEREV